MKQIEDFDELRQLKSNSAVLILFGGEHCNVCKNLRPQLADLLNGHFPAMQGVYVDCEIAPDICAQHAVFSLPVVKAYIEGMLVAEEAGSFSLRQLAQSLQRPYELWRQT